MTAMAPPKVPMTNFPMTNDQTPVYFGSLVIGILVIGILVIFSRHRRSRARGRLEINPDSRDWLGRLGLITPEQFLSLPALTVSGHPDRNVSRVVLDSDQGPVACYLKREHQIPWKARLRNWLDGFGAVSRSLRECRTLQALDRDGIPCPTWIAAGEDGQGRAFLLLHHLTDHVDLRRYLLEQRDRDARRRLVREIGRTLARMHHAGFTHPDLYANHVLVCPQTQQIRLLDWQRTTRRYRLAWNQRGQDLAALHATLPGILLQVGERWLALRTYLQEVVRLTAGTGQATSTRGILGKPLSRRLLEALIRATSRRLRRRHVLEKRQQGLTQPTQDWQRLYGEALCVTSRLAKVWPNQSPRGLDLDQQPVPARGGYARRWLPIPGGRRLLLERRRTWNFRPLLGRWSSPEQRRSVLLLRLERHGIPVPRILAMGQRARGGRTDSFLLIEPAARILRLDLWLKRQARRDQGQVRNFHPVAERREVLRQVGDFLARLHLACCYLSPRCDAGFLSVQIQKIPMTNSPVPQFPNSPMTNDQSSAFIGHWSLGNWSLGNLGIGELVLSNLEGVETARAVSGSRVRRDLELLRRMLFQAGCSWHDLEEVDRGYRRQGAGMQPPVLAGKETLSCQR